MALQETAIKDFWRQFLRNEKGLFAAGGPDEELGVLIERVHPDLEFDIGPVESGKREVVISAGGIREAFPAVEALAGGAPPLPRWNVIRYRQRRPLGTSLMFQGLTLAPENIRFEITGGEPGAGIVLYMPGYSRGEHSRYLALALLALDAVLGEYDVEMKLGSIVIERPGPGRGERGLTIDRLAAVFDATTHESRN
jgi:hypothetical protein